MTPYFSITIPVYNVEKYLRQCLDSVLGQTFSDFEVIILDDGSTDNSGKICDEYAEKDSRIKVFHDVNMGLLMARRRALQHVTGEYILFLDSDDYWEKDLLESIKKTLTEDKVDVIFFRYKAVNAEGKELYQQKKLLENKQRIDDAGKFLCYQLATSFEYNSMVLKVIKKEKVDIDGDYSNVREVSMGEDALQSVKIVPHIKSMIYLDKPFYNYRVNISSVSTRITSKHLEDYIKVREVIDMQVKQYFDEKSTEYLAKVEYDIRGFVGLLSDSSISRLVNRLEWKKIQKKIKETKIFRDVYEKQKEMSVITKVYCFCIKNCGYMIWSVLGGIKKILKYAYDRY